MLLLLSFAVGHSLYYRLMGGACLSLGSAIFSYETFKLKRNGANANAANDIGRR